MSIAEVETLLNNSLRPIDFFGNLPESEIQKKYWNFAKICYPDFAKPEDKDKALEITKKINELYEQATTELEKGIYYIKDKKELFKKIDSILEFIIDGKEYKIYEHFIGGDVGDTYIGLCEDEYVYLKICSDKTDNELLEKEYVLLQGLKHISIPSVINTLKINRKTAILFEDFKGLRIMDIKKEYGKIPEEHVAWMLERMLSVIGYLHQNKTVHGNIKPDNVLIDVDIHNVMLLDYSLCIRNANENDSKYKIINENYTPSYVNSNSRPCPNVDIYSVGKLAINLLGGDEKTGGMPLDCSFELRSFIRKMLNSSENDAWALWDELIKLRNNVYGTERFQKLERKL